MKITEIRLVHITIPRSAAIATILMQPTLATLHGAATFRPTAVRTNCQVVWLDEVVCSHQPLSSPPPLLYVPPYTNLDPRGGLSSPFHTQQESFPSLSPFPAQNLIVLQQPQYVNMDRNYLCYYSPGERQANTTYVTDDHTVSAENIVYDSQHLQHQGSHSSDHLVSTGISPIRAMSFVSSQERYSNMSKNPYECGICAKTFTKPSALIRHVKSHSKPHQCDICQRRFGKAHCLTVHMRTHTGYECDICQLRFSRKHILANHMRIHNGNKDQIN